MQASVPFIFYKELGANWYGGSGHEYHYSLVEPGSDQPSVLSPYSALSSDSGQQRPHESH